MRFPVLSIMLISASLASISTAAAEPYVGFGVGTAFYEADLSYGQEPGACYKYTGL